MQAGANVKAIIEAMPHEGGFPVQANRVRRLGIPIMLGKILVKALPNDDHTGIVGAVIAESFGRIFFRNAINLGIPAITCKDIGSFAKKGDKLAVDFATGEIKNLTQNTTTKAEPFSEYVFNILQSGGIKPMIRAQLTGK